MLVTISVSILNEIINVLYDKSIEKGITITSGWLNDDSIVFVIISDKMSFEFICRLFIN